ncbi:MAG TPA: hypothetical protein VN131_07425, partial [Mobilitalea sp.]|nr:hypothetical protein [Mobilitalea sp.]
MRKKIVSLLLIGSILLGFNSNEIAKADSTNTGSALADTVTEGPEKTTYIPEDLLDFIEQNMNQGKERDSFSAMVCDKELSSKDLDSYKNNASLKEYLDMLNDYSGLALKVDADNDGIEDLF